MRNRSLTLLAVLAIMALSLGPPVLHAAGPEGTFLVQHGSNDLGTDITNTAATAGTINGAPHTGVSLTAVSCTFNQSAHTNTPSTTIVIQGLDAASGLWYSLITSTAVTTGDNTPTTIAAGLGVATTANVGAGVPLPKEWRVSETIGGTTPIVTGTIDCRSHY